MIKKININWGHKLVFFTVLFMIFIITMVYLMLTQKVDLVEADYYEKGINYQQEMDKYKATKGMDHQITYLASAQQLTFQTAMGGNIQGTIKFYRPSDSKMDFEIPFMLDSEGKFIYSTQNMAKGLWKVIFEWKAGEVSMATVKEIFVE